MVFLEDYVNIIWTIRWKKLLDVGCENYKIEKDFRSYGIYVLRYFDEEN